MRESGIATDFVKYGRTWKGRIYYHKMRGFFAVHLCENISDDQTYVVAKHDHPVPNLKMLP
jgi:hypothetical protein